MLQNVWCSIHRILKLFFFFTLINDCSCSCFVSSNQVSDISSWSPGTQCGHWSLRRSRPPWSEWEDAGRDRHGDHPRQPLRDGLGNISKLVLIFSVQCVGKIPRLVWCQLVLGVNIRGYLDANFMDKLCLNNFLSGRSEISLLVLLHPYYYCRNCILMPGILQDLYFCNSSSLTRWSSNKLVTNLESSSGHISGYNWFYLLG